MGVEIDRQISRDRGPDPVTTGLLAIVLGVLWMLLVGCGGGGGGAAGVCCQIAGGSCASGPTVTAEFCRDELGGTVDTGDCNLDTGLCE